MGRVIVAVLFFFCAGIDTASRLTNITYLGSPTNQIASTYDQGVRRVSQASALSAYNLPVAVTNSTYDAANRQLIFGSYNLLYDANGNVTNIINGTVTNQLVWNARNQLTNMLGAITANFLYDGLGRRITRTVSSATEKYLYDGSDIIQQLNNSGTTAATYFRGLAVDEPWQRQDFGGVALTNRVYLADGLGSIIALADTNKVISTQYFYDPFGGTTNTGTGNKNSYQFTGRENDATGLYYYRARYYHPALGRFISEDPFGMMAGDVNVYVYGRNSSLNLIDPSGMDPNGLENQLINLPFNIIAGVCQVAGYLSAVGGIAELGELAMDAVLADIAPADLGAEITASEELNAEAGIAPDATATRAFWIGENDGLLAAQADNANVLQLSPGAQAAFDAGVYGPMQAESAAWAQGAVGETADVYYCTGAGRTFWGQEFPQL